MKKIVLSLTALTLFSFSYGQQKWNGPDNTTGAIERSGDVKISSSNQTFLTLESNGTNNWDGGFIKLNALGATGNHLSSFLYFAKSPSGVGEFVLQRRGVNQNFYGNLLYYADGLGWTFNVANSSSSTSVSNGLKISNTGNIGIGTTNPLAKLHLIGPDNAGSSIYLESKNPNSGIRIKQTGQTGWTGNAFTLALQHGAWFGSTGPFNQGIYMDENIGLRFFTGNSEKIRVLNNGNVGIGTTNPTEKLTVKGKILCSEVEVVDISTIPDYVFQKYYTGTSKLKEDYQMPTLEEVEAFTKANHHLPEVPSAKEIKEEGMQLKEMTTLLLQKVEELTLYTIEQEKRIKALEAQLAEKE